MPVVQKTRKAFRGNVRRAIHRLISGKDGIALFMNRHPDWPKELLSAQLQIALGQITVRLETALNETYPVGPG